MKDDILARCMQIINEANDIASRHLAEKWGTETKVSPAERGKYQGRNLSSLRAEYNQLKKSGPHPRGSSEYGKMRELAFAIRAKTGWGKVSGN